MKKYYVLFLMVSNCIFSMESDHQMQKINFKNKTSRTVLILFKQDSYGVNVSSNGTYDCEVLPECIFQVRDVTSKGDAMFSEFTSIHIKEDTKTVILISRFGKWRLSQSNK